ncbi:MAG: type II toxin-antitoxin system prevent-host-death family antitoxin [Propionibacteriaceae bacterium]|jgi:prevent-host-death family protein|nr:type II toxin-antitoxin system prevent-host-death family antitoxin [Propionibacteriaceae bacterium]
MRTVTATAASRGFKDVLDAVDSGESYTITRGGNPIAQVIPFPKHKLSALVAALEDEPPDGEWADLTEDVHNELNTASWEDPWAEH